MSYFGVNLKKIRLVKKLNQTEFAKLFGLTRSAVGAYEEGRAEAKIDKIIEIADFFGISIDSFLKKKLTVNEILHFDSNKISQIINADNSIPFVEAKRIKQYINNIGDKIYLSRINKLILPDTDSNCIAFEVSDKRHFLDSEIIVCSRYDNKPKKNDWYFGITKQGTEIFEKILYKKKYLEIWRIEKVLFKNLYKVNTNKLLLEIKNISAKKSKN
jgi:transcriptional regulator with XRE-family HTH domain